MRHHGAFVFEKCAHERHGRHRRRRQYERRPRRAAIDQRDERAEKHEPRHADDGRDEPHQHRGDNPPPHAACQLPKAKIEVQRRFL